MTDTITLRKLAARATPVPWVKGKTTHHTVTDKGYHIAEWHHADDAALMDALYPQKVIDLLNELDSLRAALAQQAEQGWQPASNPPTEAHGEVLALMRDGTCEIAWATYWHGSITSFAGWTFRDPDIEDTSPTHWMPLPAAPKGGV